MTKVELFVKTLGIPKENKCSSCGKKTRFNDLDRKNFADCMVNNCAGIWCLTQCDYCGYTERMYPIRINGIDCTKDECDKLFNELVSFFDGGDLMTDEEIIKKVYAMGGVE